VEIDERKLSTFDSSEVGLLERDTFVLHVCKDMLVEHSETVPYTLKQKQMKHSLIPFSCRSTNCSPIFISLHSRAHCGSIHILHLTKIEARGVHFDGIRPWLEQKTNYGCQAALVSVFEWMLLFFAKLVWDLQHVQCFM